MAATSTFHHNDQFTAETNPKDVGYLLATTVKDDDAVVFTKTSLIQFLKSHDIQVDTNYSELKGLPRYATFGRFSKPNSPADDVITSVNDATQPPVGQQTYQDLQPRRAPAPPTENGSDEHVQETAQPERNHRGDPPPSVPCPIHAHKHSQDPSSPLQAHTAQEQTREEHKSDLIGTSKGVGGSQDAGFRPTRRVREAIGGGSEQVASLFAGQDEQENTPPKRNICSRRGTFIVVEGLDRAGKSTQVELLAQRMEERLGKDAVRVRKFPDRTTPLGQVLNTYLTSPDVSLHPRAAHLLFSANRWELATSILSDLSSGITTVADRYVASGIAYSLVKDLPLDWLVQPDTALPAPDLTLFMSISASEAAKRGGYGNERYEKEEIQRKVRSAFARVEAVFNGELDVAPPRRGGKDGKSGEWITIDAGRDRDQVWKDVWAEVERVDDEIRRSGRGVGTLFE